MGADCGGILGPSSTFGLSIVALSISTSRSACSWMFRSVTLPVQPRTPRGNACVTFRKDGQLRFHPFRIPCSFASFLHVRFRWHVCSCFFPCRPSSASGWFRRPSMAFPSFLFFSFAHLRRLTGWFFSSWTGGCWTMVDGVAASMSSTHHVRVHVSNRTSSSPLFLSFVSFGWWCDATRHTSSDVAVSSIHVPVVWCVGSGEEAMPPTPRANPLRDEMPFPSDQPTRSEPSPIEREGDPRPGGMNRRGSGPPAPRREKEIRTDTQPRNATVSYGRFECPPFPPPENVHNRGTWGGTGEGVTLTPGRFGSIGRPGQGRNDPTAWEARGAQGQRLVGTQSNQPNARVVLGSRPRALLRRTCAGSNAWFEA